MKTTVTPIAAMNETQAIACPACGRPARATVLQKLIAQIVCRRCHQVWQIASACS